MGTKSNPGQFDCYAKAAPDEPVFVLLGRDQHAPTLVRLWALLRHRTGEDEAKVREALACADAMDGYCAKLGESLTPGDLLHSNPGPDECVSIIEGLLTAATSGMDEHPEGYEHACDCDECRSCG